MLLFFCSDESFWLLCFTWRQSMRYASVKTYLSGEMINSSDTGMLQICSKLFDVETQLLNSWSIVLITDVYMFPWNHDTISMFSEKGMNTEVAWDFISSLLNLFNLHIPDECIFVFSGFQSISKEILEKIEFIHLLLESTVAMTDLIPIAHRGWQS